MSQERTGVLLLRVWADESDRRLRARITHVLDITTPEERVVMAGSVEEIERAVREWLVEFSPSRDTALTGR
jgi:16S rRNA G1207 methylase RsmC